MSGDEKDGEQEEGKTEVKENDSKPLLPGQLIKSDEAVTQADANVAEDQELKMLPENDGEQDKVVEVEDTTIKSLPRATRTNTTISKRKKNQLLVQKQKEQQRKEIPIRNVSKKLEQQGTEIKNIKSIMQSQSQLIKQIKSQLKQVQKQISRIQKHSTKKKKKK